MKNAKSTKVPSSPASLLRGALTKILPGYNWTVHKPISKDSGLTATGIQSSGFNRCSTVNIQMRPDGRWFDAKVAGFGLRAPWLASGHGTTLAQAIRSLQSRLEHQAGEYRGQARSIQSARTPSAVINNDNET